MHINKIVCDQCEILIKDSIPNLKQAFEGLLLYRRFNQNHFCNIDCLKAWLDKQSESKKYGDPIDWNWVNATAEVKA